MFFLTKMRRFDYYVKRDYSFAKKYLNYEHVSIFNKSVYNEFQLLSSFSYKFYKRYYLKTINYASKYRIRCFFSGRVRGTLSFFMMSRMVFKKLALNGFVIGVKKAS